MSGVWQYHWSHIDQLDEITKQLKLMRKEIHHMSGQMAELQGAISDLVSDVQAQVTATEALIQKITDIGVEADLSDEIQAVKDASASLENSKAAADNVLNPPAPDTPPVDQPPDQPPVDPTTA